jgi:hypothetical protein
MAPLGRDPGRGAIAQTPETCQPTANGLSPSVTFTHDPLNNYPHSIRPRRAIDRSVPATGQQAIPRA